MKKIFISQPMRFRTKEEIQQLREHATEWAAHELCDSVEVVNPPYCPGELRELGKAIYSMEEADFVIFTPGYSKYRGCRVEQMVAVNYNKKCLYMKEGTYGASAYESGPGGRG